MTPLYAVFGHPVAHSRSPQIHAAFAAQAGIALTYERIDAAPNRFATVVAEFARGGGRGANVTLPHKQAAMAMCETLGERARRAGAVNTLLRIEGEALWWHGDNTDGIGLVRDLRDRHGLALQGARVLLLGAGGAGAGVAPALLDAGVGELLVLNRNVPRARALAEHLDDARVVVADGDVETRASGIGWSDAASGDAPPTQGTRLSRDALSGGRIDVVINATSAARSGDAPWSSLATVMARAIAAIDLGYGEAARPFLDFARTQGAARRIDGLGMLVEQAAESFRLWHGVTTDTAPVYAQLRHELGPPP